MKPKSAASAFAEDPFALYTAAVQSIDADLEFVRRVYRAGAGRALRSLREDFCGTARLACAWAAGGPRREAWGVDLDPQPLAWGEAQYRQPLGAAAARVHLVRANVLTASTPRVDAILALNFSYCVFKERLTLRRYLRRARAALAPGGMLVLDIFGGTGAITATREERAIVGATGPDGRPLPRFRFVWEHAHFDAISHHVLCHIHFRLGSGRWLQKAYTYDWRLWTIPELRELMAEAGFAASEVHTHGWTKAGLSNGVYRPVSRFDNEIGWLAYVVGRA